MQVAGIVSLVVGLLVLFLLREPLYALIVVVLKLIGILLGFLLVIVGMILILGGKSSGRRRVGGLVRSA